MHLDFRKLAPGATPGAGELWVRPKPAFAADHSLAVAELVLDRGPGGLVQGPGPVERVVVDVSGINPTFDDLLAAALVRRRLAGEAIPDGLRAVAAYARAARKGLRPGSVPPEYSIAGVF